MALVRVAQYSSTPGPVTDYQAQNAHLQAFTNQLLTQQFILDAGTDQPVIKQGCYVSHGGSLYIADADTAITGSPSDGSVYIRVSGTTSLTVEFVNDISGYAWNPVYSALTSGTYTLLPYLIVKASTVWTRYNFNPNNQSVGGALEVTGAISGASINTGYGDNEVYKISNETIDFGSASANTTKQIGSMASGEIKFVQITGTLNKHSSNTYSARLNAPSGGTYLVLAGVPGSSAIGIVVGGGAVIWNKINSNSRDINLECATLIRRL